MKERPDEPDGKACTEYHPERKLLLETYKGHEEDKNRMLGTIPHNAPFV